MMKLKELVINYFMSFGPDNRIPLMDRGLTLINGVNKISTTASSNGSGKTNLQEALFWACFDKTTKNVLADDVVNNIHKKDCSVEAIFQCDDGYEYHICRYRKHSEFGNDLHFFRIQEGALKKENLEGVDKKETQFRIEHFLGCGSTLFCNSSYFSQLNVKPFATFTDKQLKEVLLEALDMTRFSDAKEKVRFDLKTYRKELDTLTGRQDRLNEEFEESDGRIAEYETKQKTFAEDKAQGIKKIDEKMAGLKTQIDEAKTIVAKIPALLEKIKGYEEILRDHSIHLKSKKDLDASTERFVPLFTALQRDLTNLKNKSLLQSNELKSVEKRVGTDCSECGKTISKADLNDVIAGINAKISTTKAELVKAQNLVKKASPKMENFQKQEDNIQSKIDACTEAEKNIADLKITVSEYRTAESNIKIFKDQMVDLYSEKKAISEAESPWEGLISKEQELQKGIKSKIDIISPLIKSKMEEIEYLEFWELGFGYSGIPSFLLDTVTPFLNEKSNHYSSIITAGDVKIDFSTITKTKKGELKEKFAINIGFDTGSTKYEGTSGGERKRANICVAQSIQDLVRSYGKNTLAYCSYDEPFEDLDAEGVSYVIDLLQEVAKEVGTVLVVTHNDELKSMFRDSITVIKDEDGFSRVEA